MTPAQMVVYEDFATGFHIEHKDKRICAQNLRETLEAERELTLQDHLDRTMWKLSEQMNTYRRSIVKLTEEVDELRIRDTVTMAAMTAMIRDEWCDDPTIIDNDELLAFAWAIAEDYLDRWDRAGH